MPQLAAVAYGTAATGERWTIQAGGTARRFLTVLEVELPDGRRQGTGCADPLLPPNRLFVVSTGVYDDGPLQVVGRSHPSINRIRLQFANETPDIELTPVGDPIQYGVRFFTALLPRETRIAQVSALDMDGNVQDTWTGPFATAQDLQRAIETERTADHRLSSHPVTRWRPLPTTE